MKKILFIAGTFLFLTACVAEPKVSQLSAPNDGFVILNSIYSNNKEEIVYTEMSECITKAENFSSYLEDKHVVGQPCSEWDYNIFIKDLESGDVRNIYSESSGKKLSFIPIAEAGGCRMVHLPIAWSANDKEIILEKLNPSSCGSEPSSSYSYFTISAEGGDVESLATDDALFTTDYDYVIYTENSLESPSFCGPTDNNNGKIVLKDIEDGSVSTLLEEPNSNYHLLKIEGVTLEYKVTPFIPDELGCGELNEDNSELKSIELFSQLESDSPKNIDFSAYVDEDWGKCGVEEVKANLEKNPIENIHPDQITDCYFIGDMYFAFVSQPNNWTALSTVRDWESSGNKAWSGLLYQNVNGPFEVFFEIPQENYNPIGLYLEKESLVLDTADDSGGGSGEGRLLTFRYSFAGVVDELLYQWTAEKCTSYYIPENYVKDSKECDTVSNYK